MRLHGCRPWVAGALLLLCGACAGAGAAGPATTPPQAQPGGGGSIRGRLAAHAPPAGTSPWVVVAAPFAGDGEGRGAFVYREGRHPKGVVAEGGGFLLSGVPPGRYVLLAGAEPRGGRPLSRGGGAPLVVTVPAVGVVDVGILEPVSGRPTASGSEDGDEGR